MDLSRLMVMGILNVTPDSFSDGGLYNSPGEAIKHAAAMTEAGTDIIDIGGLSTRPDSAEIPVDDEIARVIPVIRHIREFNKNVLISADTYRSEVAAAAMEAGADIINDISGGAFDPAIREVAAHYDAPYIIMHTPGKPSEMQKMTDYDELMSTIYHYLSEKGKEAEAKGVKRIIADPGIGFGKTIDQNFEILSRMEELLYLGYPLLIGLSRKSFIGKTLDLDTGQRDIPTSILEGFSVSSGARIIRTHNILHASYLKQLINRILQY
ncbi:MAG: dihydropteroate synthase [Ignavibacteriaceae bacterium]|nr:dihydropteroate synthase [Ignavibacteriaceae bacterium]